MIQRKRREFHSHIRRAQIEQTMKQKRQALIAKARIQQQLASLHTNGSNNPFSQYFDRIFMAIKHQQQQQFDHLLHKVSAQLRNRPIQASFSFMMDSKTMRKIIRKVVVNRTVMTEGQDQWEKIDSALQQHAIFSILDILSYVSYIQVKEEYYYNIAQSLWQIIQSPHLTLHSSNNPQFLPIVLKVLKEMLRYGDKTVIKVLKQFNLGQYLSQIVALRNGLQRQYLALLSQIVYAYLVGENQSKDTKQASQIEGIDILGTQSSQYQQFLKLCLMVINNKMKEAYFASLCAFIHIIDKQAHLTATLNPTLIANLIEVHNYSPLAIRKKVVELICDIIYREAQLASEILANNDLLDSLQMFLYEYSTILDEHFAQYTYIVSCIICNLAIISEQKGIRQFFQHKIWELALQNLRNGSLLLPLIHIFQYHPNPKPFLDNYLFSVSLLSLQLINIRQLQCIKRTIKRCYYKYSQSLDEDEPKWIEHLLERHRLLWMIEQGEYANQA